MTKYDVFEKTQDISHDFVGIHLGADIRAGWTKYGWQAYLVTYNRTGNVESVRVLRIKKGKQKGKPVKTYFYWEGIGDLIERIEQLHKKGQI